MFLATRYNFRLLSAITNVSSKSVRNVKRKLRNPGLDRQMKLYQSKDELQEDIDFENLEADFTSLNMTHREHEHEIHNLHETLKYKIIERKYFKKSVPPNFLTWSDKEQIRLLHKQHPDEYTPEKLAEGFPALPQVIQSIIESKWVPSSENKIKNHDRSVARNWQLYKNGKLNLSTELKEHLNKFSERSLGAKNIQHETALVTGTSLIENNSSKGEFGSIVSSYYKPKENEDLYVIKADSKSNNFPVKKGTYILRETDSNKLGKSITLDTFKNKLQNEKDTNKITPGDELILHKLTQSSVKFVDETNSELTDFKEKDKKVGMVEMKQNVVYSYPEKIKIPTKYYERGSIYKVNDCFYSSKGDFLYRVPGLCD